MFHIIPEKIRIVSVMPVPAMLASLRSEDPLPTFHQIASARLLGAETTLEDVAQTLFGPAVMQPDLHTDNPYVMAISQNYLTHALQEQIVTPGAMILSMNGGNEWLSRTYMTSPSPGRLFVRYDLIDQKKTVSGRPPVFLSTPFLDLRYESASFQLMPGEESSDEDV